MINTRVKVNHDTDIISIKITTDIRNGSIIIDELSDVCRHLAHAHLVLGDYSDAIDMQENSEYLCTKFVDLMEVIEKDVQYTKDTESSGS